MSDSKKYLRYALFDLNRKVNDATTFGEKQLYRGFINSLLDGLDNIGMEIDLPDSLLSKSIMYDNLFDDNYHQKVILSYRKNRKFYKQFAKLSDCTLDYYLDEEYKYKEKLSFRDAIDIVDGFFDYYDKDISKHFNDLLGNGLLRVLLPDGDDPSTYNGFTYPIPGSNSLVTAQDDGNIVTAGVIAHEAIHSYLTLFDGDLTYEEDINKSINDINEVYPRFIEIALMNYLYEVGFDKTDISSYMKNYNSLLADYLFVFDDTIKAREHVMFGEEFGVYVSSRKYSLGSVLAYHYYDKYLDDPYAVKGDLLRLYHDSRDKDFSHLFDNCGLEKKNIVKPKMLVKHLNDFDL